MHLPSQARALDRDRAPFGAGNGKPGMTISPVLGFAYQENGQHLQWTVNAELPTNAFLKVAKGVVELRTYDLAIEG